MVNVWKPEMKLPESTSAILIGPGLAAPEIAGKIKNVHATTLARFAHCRWSWMRARWTGCRRANFPHESHPRHHAASGRGGAAAEHDGATSAGESASHRCAKFHKRFGNCWVVLKGHQTSIGRSRGRNFCEFVRQSASGARRQRRCAGGFHRRTAGATGVAGGRGQNHPLRRLAARRGGGQIAGDARELDGGRFGG